MYAVWSIFIISLLTFLTHKDSSLYVCGGKSKRLYPNNLESDWAQLLSLFMQILGDNKIY